MQELQKAGKYKEIKKSKHFVSLFSLHSFCSLCTELFNWGKKEPGTERADPNLETQGSFVFGLFSSQ